MSLQVGTARPLAMTAFEKAMYNQWNRQCEVTTKLSQDGEDVVDTSMMTQRFGIPGNTGAPTRKYGDELPSEFDTCEDSPTFAYSEVDLVWAVATGRIRFDMLQLKDGFMGDPVQFSLDNLVNDVMFEAERNMCSGIGDDVIFNLNGAGTDNLNGTFTYPVVNYGGIAGQLLGQLMKALLLEGTPIQASSAVGQPPGNTAAVKIVSVVSTPGSETITTDGDLGLTAGPVAAGWIVYRAHRENGGVQEAEMAPVGLPKLISDWTDYALFQEVDATEAPRFESSVIRSPGAPMAFDENLLNKMLSLGEVALPAEPKDKKGPPTVNGFFLTHTWNVNKLAQSLTADRRFMTPPLRNAGAAGYVKKYLSYCEHPVVGAHLAQRSSAYYVIAANLFVRKNGPMWGQFMVVGGQSRFAIPCSPDQEVRWVRCAQNASHRRPGMVRADNVEEARFDA